MTAPRKPSAAPAYRMATIAGKRVRVVPLDGVDGYVCRWSGYCAGCIPDRESVSPPERGSGCRDCGYTGRSRREEWVPLDMATRAGREAARRAC